MIRTYVGKVGGRNVEARGENVKDAMERAGYMPLTCMKQIGKLVGKLTTGQRFSFRIAANSSFHHPVAQKPDYPDN